MKQNRIGPLYFGLYLALVSVLVWQLSQTRHSPEPEAAEGLGERPHLIALVEFQGPITSSGGGFSVGGVRRTVQQLKSFRKRDDIKAILLRINSPGGTVGAVQEIHQELMALRGGGKIIVSSLGDVAASGGYYLASASHKIVANPGTLTGSIGVLFQMGNVQKLFQKVGVHMETVKSGAMKDSGSPFRVMRPQEKAVFQALVNDAYDQFLDAVAEGRQMPKGQLRPLADGRIYTGAQAKERGLVDELGNMNTAILWAKKLAGIEGKKALLIETISPWERFLGMLQSRVMSGGMFSQAAAMSKTRFEYRWE